MRWIPLFLAAFVAVPAWAAPTAITNVDQVGGELVTLTTNGTVYGRNRIVGGTVTTFTGAATSVLITRGGTPVPASGTRASLLGDWSLDTGLTNIGATAEGMTITFPQAIINRAGPDIVLFEANSGSAPDTCTVKINGVAYSVTAAVDSNHWGSTGYGTESADQYNSSTTPASLAELESANLTLSSSDVNQTIWGIALDLSDFGVANGASVTSLTITSTSTSAAIDPVMVAGLVAPAAITGGPVVEELMADNSKTLEDEDQAPSDWIEIYNGQDAVVDLGGYRLTNDPAQPSLWTFPSLNLQPFAYTYVFASGKNKAVGLGAHLHTNFTLAKEGGTVVLSKPDGTIVSNITYPAQATDVSYGALGASQALGYLEIPTPGVDNAGRQAAAAPIDDIAFDKVSGVITGATTLTMSLPANAPAGSEIRYTLTATEPLENSTLYTGPLNITTGTTITARIFKSGYLPSRVCHRSFTLLASDLATNYNSSGLPFSSNLPIVVLDSFGVNVDTNTSQIGARPHKFTQATIYDVNSTTGKATISTTPTLVARSGLHVRGQSSSGFTQKPYAWEFWKEHSDEDEDVAVLGMPADSDWVLMTLYTDKTFMRNYLMQQLLLEADGPTAGRRCRFVEVFFNQGDSTTNYSDYAGVFLLMESIKRTSNRVNISKLNAEMTAAAQISGGFIFKKDKTPYTTPFNPTTVTGSLWNGLTYDVHTPDPPTATQVTALKTFINQADTRMVQADFATPTSANYYGNYLDWRSFIDKMLWQETCREVDSYIYSSYLSKDRGGPIRAFPFWDVDRSLGNADYGGSDNTFGWAFWKVASATGGGSWPYFPRLLQDPEYTLALWDRWWQLRRGSFSTTALLNRIDTTASQLTNASDPAQVIKGSATTLQNPAARHFRKYNTIGVNSYSGTTAGPVGQTDRTNYKLELDLMKNWLSYRLEWLDGQSGNGLTTTVDPGLRPPNLVDLSTSQQRYGGSATLSTQFALVETNETAGTTYYTLNGVDPRARGDAVAPGAQTLSAGSTTYTNLVARRDTTWKYLAPAAAPAANWMNTSFDDSAWTVAPAPIGYNETAGTGAGQLATVLATPAQTTTAEPNPVYLRKSFTVANAANVSALQMELMVDDGAVIYLNGTEVARVAMPYAPTAITFSTETAGVIDDSRGEGLYNQIKLDPTKLVTGTNVLAVEVHQALYTSTATADMRFDLRLKATTATSYGTPLTLPSSGAQILRARTLISGRWTPLTEATFVVDAGPPTPSNLVVSELHYHPAALSAAETANGWTDKSFEYVELLNIGTAAIDLSSVKFTAGVFFDFANAATAARSLAPGARVVIVANQAAFASRLVAGASPLVAGVFSDSLKDSGETLTITGVNNAVLKSFFYGTDAPWPKQADGKGASLVLNNPFSNPDHALAASWRPSFATHGQPGYADSTPAPTDLYGDSVGNGIPNLLRYMLGNSPFVTVTSEPFTPSTTGAVTDQYLYLRFPRNLAADGFTPVAELSTNLTTWSANGMEYVSTVRATDGSAVVTYRSTQPVSQMGGKVFGRVRIAP